MNTNHALSFDLTDSTDVAAYQNVIKAYTMAGLTFAITQHNVCNVVVTLTGGY